VQQKLAQIQHCYVVTLWSGAGCLASLSHSGKIRPDGLGRKIVNVGLAKLGKNRGALEAWGTRA